MQFSKFYILFLFPVFINAAGSNFLRMKFSSNKKCTINVEAYTEKHEFLLSAIVPVYPGTSTYQAFPYIGNLSYKFTISDMITGKSIGTTLPRRLKLANENIHLTFKDSHFSSIQSSLGTTVKIETNVDCPENFTGLRCQRYIGNKTLTNN